MQHRHFYTVEIYINVKKSNHYLGAILNDYKPALSKKLLLSKTNIFYQLPHH